MKPKNTSRKTHTILWWMFLPCAIYYFIFDYIPMTGLIISFKDYSISKGILGSEWVGFKHFAALFSGPDFATALRNTLIISVIKIILGFFAPVVLSLIHI